jgi:signal transduction histidine kinase
MPGPSYAANEELLQLTALVADITGARGVRVVVPVSTRLKPTALVWGDATPSGRPAQVLTATMGGRSRAEVEIFDGETDSPLLARLLDIIALSVRNSGLARQAQRARESDELATLVHGLALAGVPDDDTAMVVADGVRRVIGADVVVLGRDSGESSSALEVQALSLSAAHDGSPAPAGRSWDRAGTALAGVWRQQVPLRGAGRLHPGGPLAGLSGPWLMVPTMIDNGAWFYLVAQRHEGSARFDSDDAWLVQALCSRLVPVLEFPQRRQLLADERAQAERARMSEDLHDLTIGRLYGIGMMLEAALRLGGGAGVAPDRAATAIAAINDTIAELRGLIAGYEDDASPLSASQLRSLVQREVSRQANRFGTAPMLDVDLPIDTVMPTAVARDFAAAVREGLSNAVRHGDASGDATVALTAEGRMWVVRITSAGSLGHTPEPGEGHGLRNLTERASRLGGGCQLDGDEAGRTVLTWWVARS